MIELDYYIQWLTDTAPQEEHDLTGLRDNFDPKARWKSAINGAIAMSRLKRAGSERSRRSLSAGEESADEAESMGWRTPANAESSPATGHSTGASASNLSTMGGHLAVAGSRGTNGHSSEEDEDDMDEQKEESNENVRVHPPNEDGVQRQDMHGDLGSPSSGSSGKSDPAAKDATLLHRHAEVSMAEPTTAQTLKREDEKPHAAVHNVPEHHFSVADGGGGGGGSGDKRFPNITDAPRSSVSSDRLVMPGSFDNKNDAPGNAHPAWSHLFQKLGFRR